MIRPALAVLLTVGAVSGCGLIGPDPEVTSLPPVFGARITDGALRLWTGTPCTQVSRVVVLFSPDGARLTLEPPQGRRADVEFLTVGGPYPGLDVVEPLPAGFDWRTSREVTLIVDAPQAVGATPIGLAEITRNSAAHPEGSFFFEGVGWLDPAQVAAQNRTSLLTVCTPDPG
ncbi:hypothetical protein L2K20_12775 [Mycobacterium sp. MBM]|nr:hypothetical protein [Mycobacterium sp. MBM]